MHSNVDGTYLDPDGRPRPLAGADLPPVPVDQWKLLGRRGRAAVWTHYLSFAAYPFAAALAAALWTKVGWVWLPTAAVTLASMFVWLAGVLLILRPEPDGFQRRMTFAALNCFAGAVMELTVMAAIALAWWHTPDAPEFWTYALVILAAAFVLDVRAGRRMWPWLLREVSAAS